MSSSAQRQHSPNRHSSDAGTGNHNHRGSCQGQGQGEGASDTVDASGSRHPSGPSAHSVVPGATNVNASAVTRDTVRQTQAEEKRQLDLKILQSAPRTFNKDTVDMLRGRRGPHIPAAHLCSRPHLLDQLQRGTVLSADVQRAIPTASVSALQPRGHCKVTRYSSDLWYMTSMVPSADYSHLLCLWELRMTSDESQCLQLLDLADIVKKDETGRVELTVQPMGFPLRTDYNIVDICFADIDPCTEETSGRVLYVQDGDAYGNTDMSSAVINKLHITGDPLMYLLHESSSQNRTEYEIGSDSLWCCAWDKHKQCFSLGSEKCAYLVDPNRVSENIILTVNTDQVDVFAQTFSKQTGHVLYSGTNKDVVLAHDTRDREALFELRTSPTLLHKLELSDSAGVCHLYCSPDDLYLTVAEYSGKISRWDLRQKKILMEYKGHYNSSTNLRVHVCEEQQLVYAVGEDNYTRFWCQRTGKLLYTLPPPYPAAYSNADPAADPDANPAADSDADPDADPDVLPGVDPGPPTVCYSQHLGYGSGYPGLLMGVSDELHLYS